MNNNLTPEELNLSSTFITSNLKKIFDGLISESFSLCAYKKSKDETFFYNHIATSNLDDEHLFNLHNQFLSSFNTTDSRWNHAFLIDIFEASNTFSFHLNFHLLNYLQLTPRLIGNNDQIITYDYLSTRENNIISGKSSFNYHRINEFDISWKSQTKDIISYLKETNQNLVKMFFYEKTFGYHESFKKLLNQKTIKAIDLGFQNNLFEVEIKLSHDNNILLRMWCNFLLDLPEQVNAPFNKYNLYWNGYHFTKKEIESITNHVYIKSDFLLYFQNDKDIDTIPFYHEDLFIFYNTPSLTGEWSINEVEYVNKYICKLPIKELYINNDELIKHIHNYQVDDISNIKKDKKNNLYYVFKLVNELIILNENFKTLTETDENFYPLSREKYEYYGLEGINESILKLTKVIKKGLTDDEFLQKMKILFEILNKVKLINIKRFIKEKSPNGFQTDNLGFLKIFEILNNFFENETWNNDLKNNNFSYLNTLYHFRLKESHNLYDQLPNILKHINYDVSKTDDGYEELYFLLFEEIINSLEYFNNSFLNYLNKKRFDIIDFDKYLENNY